jgi:hypothetical protein
MQAMECAKSNARCGARRLRSDQRGAVLAEFVIAFPVLLAAYLCFLQMAQVYVAALVMRHSTVVVARYASVAYPSKFIPDQADRAREGGGELNPSWREAAQDGLGPWKDVIRIKGAKVSLESGNDPLSEIETKIDFEYACHVPIGRLIVCQDGLKLRSVQVFSPMNGAQYAYEDDEPRAFQ